MLKRIPYSSQLISIGNDAHYEGQPVWSDGRVAYGWHYTPQATTPAPIASPSGFWVGEEPFNSYRLASKQLTLGKDIACHRHGEAQAFPCWATIDMPTGYLPQEGQVFTPSGSYLYKGALVSLDSTGRVVTYDEYSLAFYTPGQRRTDQQQHPLSICDVVIASESSVLFHATAYVAQYTQQGTQVVVVYDEELFVIAMKEGDTLYYGNGTFDQYTGPGDITISGARPWLSVQVDTVSLADLRYIDVMISGVLLFDGLRLSIDPTDGRQYEIADHEYSDDIRKLFLSSTTDTYMTAITPDRDTDGDFVYTGDYTLRVDILIDGGTGATIVKDNTGSYVYESGVLVAHETTTGNLYLYDHQTGQQVFYGVGHLSLVQQPPGTYTGDWLAFRQLGNLSGTARIVPDGSDVYLYSLTTGAEIAHTDDDEVTVYDGSRIIYTGPGTISTPSPTPIEWRGDYTVRRDLTGYSYHIVDPTGAVSLIDGTLEASTSSDGVTIIEDGVTIYSGPGSITLSNVQPTATQGIYRGSYTINWDMTGTGRILVRSGDTYVYDLRTGDIIANESGSDVVVYDSTGAVEWTGAGWIDTTNLVPIVYEGSYSIQTIDGTTGNGTLIHKGESIGNYTLRLFMSGTSSHIVSTTAGHIELFDGAFHIVQNGETITVYKYGVQIMSKQGTIIVQQDTGSYLVTWEVVGTEPAKIVTKNGDIYLYDTQSGDLIANETASGLIVYDSSGNIDWNGSGQIDTTDVVTTDDVHVYPAPMQPGEIAYEDGDVLHYGQAWTGYGHIETNNETLNRSLKKYHADQLGVSEVNSYPSTWQVGTGAVLNLSDMSLLIGQQTFGSDPLGLLATSGFIFAGGVHTWSKNDEHYAISQDTGLMWHPIDQQQPATATFTGIAKCFNLSWLFSRWV